MNTNSMENLESYHALRFNRDGLKELSNSYNSRIEFMGYPFKSAEAAFQSCKVIDGMDMTRYREMVGDFMVATPTMAKMIGHRVRLRIDWEEVKNTCMWSVITEKFCQNPSLMHTLLNTDDRFIIADNDEHGCYWGVCGCVECKVKNKAQNMLGMMLMKLRTEQRNQTDCKVKYLLNESFGEERAGIIDLADDNNIQTIFNKYGVEDMDDFIKLMA